MTEQEWLAADTPGPMVAWMETINLTLLPQRKPKRFTDRKFRLWAGACRELMNPGVEWSNRLESGPEIALAISDICNPSSGRSWPSCPMSLRATLLREVFGNVFRPVTLLTRTVPCDRCNGKGQRTLGRDCGTCDGKGEIKGNADWLTPTVLALTEAAYSGDWKCLPILADALEDSGCNDRQILDHLRSPGPHVKGCWAVDLLRGRE